MVDADRCADCKWFDKVKPTGDGAWWGICTESAVGFLDEEKYKLWHDAIAKSDVLLRSDDEAARCAHFARRIEG